MMSLVSGIGEEYHQVDLAGAKEAESGPGWSWTESLQGLLCTHRGERTLLRLHVCCDCGSMDK